VGSYYFGIEARKILTLLIYRCTREKYFDEQKADSSGYIQGLGYDPAPASQAEARVVFNLRQGWFESHGGPWELNEAIGMIEIYTHSCKMGGILYFMTKRITKRRSRKRFVLGGKIFEFNVWPEDTTQSVYATLRKSLADGIAAQHSLQGRVIDLEPLDTLGPHIDWATMARSSHK
jgi:hypothetical protein